MLIVYLLTIVLIFSYIENIKSLNQANGDDRGVKFDVQGTKTMTRDMALTILGSWPCMRCVGYV